MSSNKKGNIFGGSDNSARRNGGIAVANCEIEGGFSINKFGWTPDCDTGSVQPVWDGGLVPKTYTYMTSPSTLYLSSSDSGDNQLYEIIGLDANYDRQTKTVIANGKNFVAVNGTWIRIFRIKNRGITNSVGDIYISDDNTDGNVDGMPDTTSSIKAKITAGNNQTLMAIYTIPNNFTGYLKCWYINGGEGKDIDGTLWIRPQGEVFLLKDKQPTFQSFLFRKFDPPRKVLEKSDIYVGAKMVNVSNKEISAGFDLTLELNN